MPRITVHPSGAPDGAPGGAPGSGAAGSDAPSFALEARAGRSLLAALAASSRVFLAAACGGRGSCGKCRVQVQEAVGAAAPVSTADRRFLSAEELRSGVRLACTLPADAVRRIALLATSDTAFTKAEMPHIPGPVDPIVRCDGPDGATCYGVAVDIGTTTLGCYLIDLEPAQGGAPHASGRVVAARSAMNRQAVFGADVLSRISHADRGGLDELRSAIVAELNEILPALAERGAAARGGGAGAEATQNAAARDGAPGGGTTPGVASQGDPVPAHIVAVAVTGNTTMLHLLLGVDPHGIGRAPFTPVFTESRRLRGAELGLTAHPGAEVHILPSISAYVGADIVAAMVAEDLDRTADSVLMIDVGTNGELVLAHDGRLHACSTAAGPAFEGATIAHGVGGVAGAIAAWRREGDDFTFETIGNAPPVGICGSGLLDVVAGLLDDGVVDETGRMMDAAGASTPPGEAAFTVAPGIAVTQGDIREVQLAKAAIAAGIEVLLDRAGLQAADLDEVVLTGGFGHHLSAASALRIGLLPEVEAGRIRSTPNAAGAGAVRALLQREVLPRMRRVAERTEYIELSGRPEFQDRYVDNMIFPAP